MLVRNWMNRKVIKVNADDYMLDATKAIKEHDIRMLPVTKDGNLVGVITDRDLKRASASDATSLEVHELLYIIANIKIEEIMTRNPITVCYDHTVEEAKRGLHFAFRLEDRPGSIKEVTDIIRKYNGRMTSILSSYEQAPKGYRYVYIRFHEIDRSHLAHLVDACKKTAALLYMVDQRDNTREIFEDR